MLLPSCSCLVCSSFKVLLVLGEKGIGDVEVKTGRSALVFLLGVIGLALIPVCGGGAIGVANDQWLGAGVLCGCEC